MMPPEQLKLAMENCCRVISRRKAFSENVFSRVQDELSRHLFAGSTNSALSVTGSPTRLSAAQVKNIASKLIIRDAKSPETLLHWNVLNDLIEQLINQNILHEKSAYFNVPQQIKRQLVSYPEKTNLHNMANLTKLRDSLLSLDIPDYTSPEEEEIDYICSYVASAVLHSKVLIPDFYKKLLSIKRKSLTFDPFSLMLPLNGTEDREHEAFYRYFLLPPTSIYLMRGMLYYESKSPGKKNKCLNGDEFIFESFRPKLKNFKNIFPKWISKRFALLGIESDSITLGVFRDVSIDLAILEATSSASHKLPTYPPLLISIQSGRIKADSCVPAHFMMSSDQPIDGNAYKFLRRNLKSSVKSPTTSPLAQAFNAVHSPIKDLKKRSTQPERNEIADKVRSSCCGIKGLLSQWDFENLSLGVEFTCRMLAFKNNNSLSKIKNVTLAVRELLCNLPQGKPIHYLPEVEIVNTVKIVSGPYKSNFITEGVQAFLDFLHSFLGSKFPVIDLGSKNLKKEIIHFPVPLIYPFHVAAAMKLCEETLCRHSLRLKDETKRQRELHKAMHRAAMCQHMVNFGYYVGLRESEFTGLRIRDVICGADGLIICVRESKTNNGKRNIPMSAFFPDVYRSDFESYYESRLLEASSGDDWLFPDYNKKRLNAGYMAGRIKAVFKQIGILNMVFHDLRHGFASFSFLRLFHAFHPELFPEGLSIRKHILFQEPYTTRLKSLILGQNHKIGQDYINHGMAALSILIGHGGPVITLEEYAHTADWLFFLISAGFEGFWVLLTAIQAENLLQVSNWSLPQDFKGRGDKKILLSEILKHQKACLFKSVLESC